MMTPKQIRAMAAYFDAAEELADAVDELIKAHVARREGLLGNCAQFEEVATAAVTLFRMRQARADYESL